MKIFSGAKTLNAASARNCFLMNQFATPGLGSLMGGRIVPGLGQLLLALLGFALFFVWFLQTMKESYSIMNEETSVVVSYTNYALAGVLFFAASWFWSLLTSISMIRQAKEEAPPAPPAAPPRITNPPPKM